jgi:hypothetical protein
MRESFWGITKQRLGEVLLQHYDSGGAFGYFGEHGLKRKRKVSYIFPQKVSIVSIWVER